MKEDYLKDYTEFSRIATKVINKLRLESTRIANNPEIAIIIDSYLKDLEDNLPEVSKRFESTKKFKDYIMYLHGPQ